MKQFLIVGSFTEIEVIGPSLRRRGHRPSAPLPSALIEKGRSAELPGDAHNAGFIHLDHQRFHVPTLPHGRSLPSFYALLGTWEPRSIRWWRFGMNEEHRGENLVSVKFAYSTSKDPGPDTTVPSPVAHFSDRPSLYALRTPVSYGSLRKSLSFICNRFTPGHGCGTCLGSRMNGRLNCRCMPKLMS